MPVRVLRPPEPPWGDYGDILLHGMSAHLGRAGGLLQLERTGPFVPPITFPGVGNIVVTESFRKRLDAAAFKDLSFRPVHKTHVVELAWESWDRAVELPPHVPESGEPEDFVLSAPHSLRVAEMLGELWEVVLPVAASVERVKTSGNRSDRIVVLLNRWNGEELFRADGVLYNYASERAQEWLHREVPEHVAFEDCEAR